MERTYYDEKQTDPPLLPNHPYPYLVLGLCLYLVNISMLLWRTSLVPTSYISSFRLSLPANLISDILLATLPIALPKSDHQKTARIMWLQLPCLSSLISSAFSVFPFSSILMIISCGLSC